MKTKDLSYISENPSGLSLEETRDAVFASLENCNFKKVLLLPPDLTRYYSNAGVITNLYYHILTDRGCEVDIMPATGTHFALTSAEIQKMYGDIPHDRFLSHNWRTDVTKLGEIPAEEVERLTDGAWTNAIDVEINRRLLDSSYDMIYSIGQVVPHEIAGMANYSKNLFVGVGGSSMINQSHIAGAFYGLEKILGRDHTPIREIFDYGLRFLEDRPITFVLTVCSASQSDIHMHGLFIGHDRINFERAVTLAQKKNITFLDHGLKKCVAYLEPEEFKSTWVGNKAIFRTCMAMEDDGDLLILAPGLRTFGEDPAVDTLIRKYGYWGKDHILKNFENDDLQANMGAAAHMIHSSSGQRFRTTFAVQPEFMDAIESVGFHAVNYHEIIQHYPIETLPDGPVTLPDGDSFYYIPKPALGVWINREKYSFD